MHADFRSCVITGMLTVTVGLAGSAGRAASDSLSDDVCATPTATCVSPVPQRARAMSAVSSPVPPAVPPVSDALDACAEPAATCVRPVAAVAQLKHHEHRWQPAHSRPPTVAELLRRWEAAATDRPAWTPAEKTWLARRHQPWLSAVALEAIVRLSATVSASELQHDFTWTAGAAPHDATVLHAVPNDETLRLFCPQLRLELAPTTHALKSVELVDRTGQWRSIELPWSTAIDSPTNTFTVVLTGLQFDVDASLPVADAADLPPSPGDSATVRFATEAVDIELRPRR